MANGEPTIQQEKDDPDDPVMFSWACHGFSFDPISDGEIGTKTMVKLVLTHWHFLRPGAADGIQEKPQQKHDQSWNGESPNNEASQI